MRQLASSKSKFFYVLLQIHYQESLRHILTFIISILLKISLLKAIHRYFSPKAESLQKSIGASKDHCFLYILIFPKVAKYRNTERQPMTSITCMDISPFTVRFKKKIFKIFTSDSIVPQMIFKNENKKSIILTFIYVIQCYNSNGQCI